MYYMNGEMRNRVENLFFNLRIKEINDVLPEKALNLCFRVLSECEEDECKGKYIETLIKRIDNLNSIMNECGSWEEDSIKRRIVEEMMVHSGYLALEQFDVELFEMDFIGFGFDSFESFVCYAGAHIFNVRMNDFSEAKYFWETNYEDGSKTINRFARNINGDFRLHQYDIPENRNRVNVFGDNVDIFYCKRKILFAYHSTEVMFFATILRYSMQMNVRIEILKNYDSFCSEFMIEGSDRFIERNIGLFMEPFLLDCDIPKKGDKSVRNLHRLIREYEGYSEAIIDNEYLVYEGSMVRFNCNDLENLVKGLHFACKDAFGRTTIHNLIAFYRLVKSKYDAHWI